MIENLMLDRYEVFEDYAIPHPTGKLVLFQDVVKLLGHICTLIEEHKGTDEAGTKLLFDAEPKVWDAVVNRDFATAAEIWTEFANANGL